jgi:hypothetical protein
MLRVLDYHNKGTLDDYRERDSQKNGTDRLVGKNSIETISLNTTITSTVKSDADESELKNTNDHILNIDLIFSKLRQLLKENARNQAKDEGKMNDDEANVSYLNLMPEKACLDNRLFEIISLLESEEDCLGANGRGKESVGTECSGSNDYLVSRRMFTSLGYSEHNTSIVQSSHYHQIDVLGKIEGVSLKNDGLTLALEPEGAISITRYGLAAVIYSTEKTLMAMSQMIDKSDDSNKGVSSDFEPNACINNNVQMESPSIPMSLECDHPFRIGLFAALLCCGLPYRFWSAETPSPFQDSLMTDADDSFFGTSNLSTMANQFIDSQDLSLISPEDVESYVMNILLPHCCRVCLLSEGRPQKSMSSFDCSSKNKDTFFFPDPMQPLSKHSINAVVNAYTLIRRCSLSKTIQSLVRGAVQKDDIQRFLRSEEMRENHHGIPCWWCPWIHDIGLLVHAAKFGLFTIIQDRKLNAGQLNTIGSVFGSDRLEKHIEGLFVKGQEGLPPFLPKKVIARASPSELKSLIKSQASHFPSAVDIERRLSFICSELSRIYGKDQDSWFYLDLPMYDHVRWPMTFSM